MNRSGGGRQGRASEDVAAQIEEAFYSEGLQPGQWLGTEAALSERFNVSRVTIRDAVGALAARGLIEVRVGARGGLRIASSDPGRLIDAFSIQLRLMGLTREELFEAMLAIEPLTASLAAKRASDAQTLALGRLVQESSQLVDDALRFTQLAVGFHQMVGELSGNRALQASLVALRAAQLEQLGPPTNRLLAERVAGIHSAIAQAIASRQPELAQQRMLAHLDALSASGTSRSHARLVASF